MREHRCCNAILDLLHDEMVTRVKIPKKNDITPKVRDLPRRCRA